MVIINDKYEIVEKIGQGSFGQVFIGIHTQTKKQIIIKIEPISSNGLLKHETNILYYLSRYHCPNIPSVFWYGNSHLSGSISSLIPYSVPSILYKCLVMSYFRGYSLDHIQDKMTWEDKLKWFHSAIKILEKIHHTGVIHRDIKPVHFILSNDGEWKLIDFGLATFYSKDKNIPENNIRTNAGEITGTPNYVSIHIHHGFEHSRRDDLISLGYIFLELCLYEIQKELPWRNEPLRKEPYKKEWEFLYTYISNISNILLQEKKNILLFYFQECESWTYETTPSYDKIKSIFL